MAISTNNFVGYDEDKHFYYLTEQGAVQYTGKQHIIDVWQNAEWRLKNMAELLHTALTSSRYNDKPLRKRYRDHVEYLIAQDENGERDAVVRALTLFVLVADDFDRDLDVMAGEKDIPESILRELRNAGLMWKGDYTGEIAEDEWRVGY